MCTGNGTLPDPGGGSCTAARSGDPRSMAAGTGLSRALVALLLFPVAGRVRRRTEGARRAQQPAISPLSLRAHGSAGRIPAPRASRPLPEQAECMPRVRRPHRAPPRKHPLAPGRAVVLACSVSALATRADGRAHRAHAPGSRAAVDAAHRPGVRPRPRFPTLTSGRRTPPARTRRRGAAGHTAATPFRRTPSLVQTWAAVAGGAMECTHAQAAVPFPSVHRLRRRLDLGARDQAPCRHAGGRPCVGCCSRAVGDGGDPVLGVGERGDPAWPCCVFSSCGSNAGDSILGRATLGGARCRGGWQHATGQARRPHHRPACLPGACAAVRASGARRRGQRECAVAGVGETYCRGSAPSLQVAVPSLKLFPRHANNQPGLIADNAEASMRLHLDKTGGLITSVQKYITAP